MSLDGVIAHTHTHTLTLSHTHKGIPTQTCIHTHTNIQTHTLTPLSKLHVEGADTYFSLFFPHWYMYGRVDLAQLAARKIKYF